MAHRIEIISTIKNARAEVLKKKVRSFEISGAHIDSLVVNDIYTIDKGFSDKTLDEIASLLTNPVTQTSLIDKKYEEKFDYIIEIGFLPGVTDNIGRTAKEIIEDFTKKSFADAEHVYTSHAIYITGIKNQKVIEKIAENLYNPLIQRAHINGFATFKKSPLKIIVPRVNLPTGRQGITASSRVDTVNLNIDEEKLRELGEFGISNKNGTRRGPLALNLDYLRAIRDYFSKEGRPPTDIELESLAQTWSEHCKHTIFADPIDEISDGLYKTFIKGATKKIREKKGKRDICVSVFVDNSGVIKFDDDHYLTHKVETHNTPSALDPYGGAITGIVGVNRDTLGTGLGAKPVANIYGFFLGHPDDETVLYRDKALTQKMLSARRIFDGVVEGVNNGGNQSGIPTPSGYLYFDPRYRGKPLVFAGTIGLLPKKVDGKESYQKGAKPGDYIVMIGGRAGRDGIHGATFSSEALTAGSPATAVQIGDPITQKKFSDALVREARPLNLYTSITDNGAGGLSSSVGEMARQSGGCEVHLEKVPLKYPGLAPWEIWISESQERMTLSVPPNKWKKFQELMHKHGVEATVIGKFTASDRCVVKLDGKTVMDIDLEFLHDGLPARPMKTILITPPATNYTLPRVTNLTRPLLDILKRPNIAGYSFISRQYDHEVQGSSVTKPLQGMGQINAEAVVMKPVLSSKKGMILSQGFYPWYSDIDTYHMSAASIDTAIRHCIAAGADLEQLALLDNFCWSSSDDPKRLYQLKQAARACYDTALIFETPFISGKDSMFNDFKGYDEQGNPLKVSIPPTLVISSIAIIDDVSEAVTIDLKQEGHLIYILGETFDEVGGSEYLAYCASPDALTNVPRVNAAKNKKLYEAFRQLTQKQLVTSAIAVTRGGLGVALAKTAMAGGLGIDVSLENLPGTVTRADVALFSESQGRIVFSIGPQNKRAIDAILKDLPFAQLGTVTKTPKIIINDANINIALTDALRAYHGTFKDY